MLSAHKEQMIFVDGHPYVDIDGLYVPAIMGGAEPEQQDDLAKVQGFIKEQVETYFNEMAQKVPVIQQGQQQVVQQQEEAGQRQLRELLSPFIDPPLQEARLQSADAQDYVKFYTGNPDAAEYQDKVEQSFEALKKMGRPTPRADILSYLIGQEYRADKGKFTEKLTTRQKEQLERAEASVDVGTYSTTRAKNDPIFSKFDQLPSEEQAKHLEGIAF